MIPVEYWNPDGGVIYSNLDTVPELLLYISCTVWQCNSKDQYPIVDVNEDWFNIIEPCCDKLSSIPNPSKKLTGIDSDFIFCSLKLPMANNVMFHICKYSNGIRIRSCENTIDWAGLNLPEYDNISKAEYDKIFDIIAMTVETLVVNSKPYRDKALIGVSPDILSIITEKFDIQWIWDVGELQLPGYDRCGAYGELMDYPAIRIYSDHNEPGIRVVFC